MNLSRNCLGIAIFAVSLAGQSHDQAAQQPGAPLRLVPSEPLSEASFPKPKAETAGSRDQRVRPAILDLKPAGDPIYLVEEPTADSDPNQWRTYRRAKVEAFSRDGEGIALQGYDVVTYLGAHAEKGKKELAVQYRGTTWLFATAEHRDLFTKDPERYLPAYGGFCAYSVGRGYPATADPRAFTIDGGRLYLFFDKAVQAVWEQDRSRLTARADHNWPNLHR
jgi:YHS domain-containing protein